MSWRTAADDSLDGLCEIGNVANRRHYEHVLIARVGRDGQQQVTVKERPNAHRHDTDVHISSSPRLRQRPSPKPRHRLRYEDDRHPQDRSGLSSTV